MSLRTHLITGATALIATICFVDRATAGTVTWDANAATAGRTDGAGVWLAADQWWNGIINVGWTSGDDALLGFGGAGGAVTLSGPTTVNSLTFNPFTGTYTLGTVGQPVTLNNGIINRSGNGVVALAGAYTLGAAQTWTNNSAGSIQASGASTLNLNGNALTFDGYGTHNLTPSAGNTLTISGAGGIVKTGTGTLVLDSNPTAAHSFSGGITVNGGRVAYQTGANVTGRGNVTLNGGYLAGRFGSNASWSGLGAGATEIRIIGGVSGFSGEGGTNSQFQIGSALSTLTWGNADFNPAELLLGGAGANTNGIGSLNNAIELNGADRIITSTQVTNGAAASGFSVLGAITNGSGTAGVTKTGVGNLILRAANTYNGGTSILGGSITLSGAGTINATNALNLGGGTLRLVNTAQVNRFADGAAITSDGGGISYENTSGANVYTETLGVLTLASGQTNIVLTTDQVGAGSQTLTLGGLTRTGASNTSAVTFSAAGAGLNATKNIVAVTGAVQTPAGQIIGPWATTGSSATVQTDYAVFDASGFVVAAGMATTNETGWTTATDAYALNTGSTETLTATRTINALRFFGASSDLALSTFRLETGGLLFSGANAKTVSAGAGGALTTATGGGLLFITAGQAGVTHTINAPVTNNGAAVSVVKSGAGVIVLNGLNTYTGDTIVNAGTLQIGTNGTANGANLDGGNYAGNIFIAAGAVLDIQTNANQTLSGVISGDGNLVKRFSGTLTLSGANTYTGRTSISPLTAGGGGGTLVVSSFNSVSAPAASSSLGRPTTVANGTIDFGNGSIQAPATLRYVGAGETTDRVINFLFNGNSSRTIDASGAGTLRFTSTPTANATTTNSIVLTGSGNGQFDGGLPFVFANLTKSGAGTWTLGGVVGLTGTTTINGGGTLVLSGDATLRGGSNAGTISFANSSTLNYNSTAYQSLDGVISGAGSIAKNNTGLLVLTAANTYSGNTTVNAGTLLVNNTTGSGTGTGNVTVNGGVFGGTGSLTGTVTVNNTGTLAPGASIESLVSGALTMNAGSTFAYEAADSTASGADVMIVNGALSLTGVNLDLTAADLSAGTWTIGDKLTLLSYTGSAITSGFTGYVDDTQYFFGANGWTINYDDIAEGSNFAAQVPDGVNYVTLQFTAIPEPGTVGLVGLALCGAGAWFRRRRGRA